jgi:hypothetical protein
MPRYPMHHPYRRWFWVGRPFARKGAQDVTRGCHNQNLLRTLRRSPGRGCDVSEQESVEFEYSGTVFTKIPDWIIFHPEATDEAVRLYAGLRSTLHEKKSRGQLRSMTLPQMQQLFPPVRANKGKRKGQWVLVDIKKVRGALQCLLRIGGVSETRKASRHSPARYRLNNAPPAGYEGWLSGWERLNHITARDGGPESRGANFGTPSAGWPKLVPLESKVGTPEAKVGTPSPENSQVSAPASAPKKDPRKKVSQEGVGAPADEPAGEAVAQPEDEREAATTEDKTSPVPQQQNQQADADRIVTAWATELATTVGVPSLQARDAVRGDVAGLLAEGETVEYLTAAAIDMARHDHTYRRLSAHLAYYTPQAAAPKVSRAERIAACPTCDAHGQYETSQGLLANCKHTVADAQLAAA